MESIFLFIQEHAQVAHWVVFGLLMLAGFNFPVSEDLLIILSGVLASTLVPENTWKLFAAVFIGAYLSDWIAYWFGRLLGPNVMKIKWFAKPERLEKITQYYKKYGILTLLVGRFIPFGVRNCLFFTAGMGRMSFLKFLIGDGIACLLSNTTLFMISYFCGKNCSSLMKSINIAIFSAFLIALGTFIWIRRRKRKTKPASSEIDA